MRWEVDPKFYAGHIGFDLSIRHQNIGINKVAGYTSHYLRRGNDW